MDQLCEEAQKVGEDEASEDETQRIEAEDGYEEGELEQEEAEYDQEEDEPPLSHSKEHSELDEYMEDLEEMEENDQNLRMPMDLQDDEEEDEEEGEAEKSEGQADGEDFENDVFALARENKEMKTYANQEMVDKIEKIENEMMDEKKWTLKGEVGCKDRNYNSLLEEYVDFDTVTKLPPQITKETTSNIESMIKQRILDELFDDPIRKAHTSDRKQDDFTLDFTKNSKGLGD